ncbi:MAG: ATP phosphoribosyltransferase [Clostridiales bacterium]|jgi:ATP phosphoribosyltransferase|nr:ATP phosphoribosyltransferase [Clostridiales bacterium]
MKYLTYALAKGRLTDKALNLFARIGLVSEETRADILGESRKLIYTDEEKKSRFFLAKASDVPTYVEYGAADIGVAGADTLLEEKRDLYQTVDLNFGRCRIVVAGPPEMESKYIKCGALRVATKYPAIAADYFYQTSKRAVEIIKLNGSVELGPMVGLSDVIVDIVETGSTLKENGLVILDEICVVSARLAVNRVSMKMEYKRVADVIQALKTET